MNSWEQVETDGGPETRRMRVDGGWLYIIVTRYERTEDCRGEVDFTPVWSQPVFVLDADGGGS